MSNGDIQDWNRISETYAGFAGEEDQHVYPLLKDVLWECLGDVRGLDVLDLGCGHGWMAQKLAAEGARVLGIDGSPEQLAKARASCPGIEFVEHDLSHGLPRLPGRFSRIVSHLVLMDISPLEPLMADIPKVLGERGRLIFTIPHPCFFNYRIAKEEATDSFYRKVTGYLEPQVWRIDSFGGHNHYHRSLSYYFDLLRAAGLAVSRIFEPAQRRSRTPDIPVFLLVEATASPLVQRA